MADDKRRAVIVVDIQADFMEMCGGTLAVPGTDGDYLDQVVARTAGYRLEGIPVLATRDHHPTDHVSFAANHPGAEPFQVVRIEGRDQVLWPKHCIQGTPGSTTLLPEGLADAVVSKGESRDSESYSAFRDQGGRDTGLKGILDELGTQEVIVYGLATDYCVRATVVHALEAGYNVVCLKSLCRAVTAEGEREAYEEMRAAGAVIEEA